MRVGIIGAGLAGLACAARLSAAGHSVALLDKGRAAGGRMSSRRVPTALGEAQFDHGAQYFTVREDAFRAEVGRWQQAGLAAPWPAAGDGSWVGTPAMNAPLKALAAHADVTWHTQVTTIDQTQAGWFASAGPASYGPYDALVLATPAENAAPLLDPVAPGLAALARQTPAEPCWTVMAAFDARVASDPDIMREQGPIGWAARNSAKPGRTGPEAWVIQAGPAWSREHLEDAAGLVIATLIGEFANRIAAPLPHMLAASAHRWRYARSGKAGSAAVIDPALRLGLCGDWLLGPRVESAWLSGARIADALLQTAIP